MSYISRSLESVVESVTKEYPVVLVTGPRQVGKTAAEINERQSSQLCFTG